MPPSNWTRTRRAAWVCGRVKALRYQATPEGKNAPAPPAGLDSSNGPAMLQSCGRFSRCQDASANSGRSAPSLSPLQKRHSASNGSVSPKQARPARQQPAAHTSKSLRFIFCDFDGEDMTNPVENDATFHRMVFIGLKQPCRARTYRQAPMAKTDQSHGLA